MKWRSVVSLRPWEGSPGVVEVHVLSLFSICGVQYNCKDGMCDRISAVGSGWGQELDL